MNNFDQSSTGINIEFSLFHDTYLSQERFQENFERDDHLQDHFHFISYGENGVIDLLSLDNYKFTKADFIKMMFHFENEEYIRDNYNGSFSKATKADIIDYWDNYLSTDFNASDLIEYYQENFKPSYEVLTVIGYCQGDQAYVIFSNESIKQYDFKDRDTFLSNMAEYFCNLFFDAPIYGRLEIEVGNEVNEIYIYELLKSEYEYDKDDLLKALKESNYLKDYTQEQQVYIVEFLENELPDQPDYN